MTQEAVTLRSIGHVETAIPDADVPKRRRDIISEIVVDPDLQDALTGIEDYSHLFVLFWMHRQEPFHGPLQYHPRGDKTLPLTGVLASRGRNHPNPIGLAVVELVERSENRLTVRRLDAFHGTPVLDIKPYDHYDVFTEIRMPEWLAKRPGNA